MFLAVKDTIKGSLAFGVSSSLSAAIGFILIPLYTRNLSVNEFGLLGLLSLTSAVSSAIFGLGLGSATFRSYFDHDDEDSRRNLVGTTLILALISCSALMLLATFGAKSLLAQKVFNLPHYSGYFQIVLYTSAINLLAVVPLAVFRARKQFVRYSLFNLIMALFQLVVIVALVVIFKWGIKGVIVGQLFSALLINGILLASIRLDMHFVFIKDEVYKLLAYGIPLVPGSLSFLLLNSGGLYFLQKSSGLYDVGIFNLAMKIVSLFAILIVTPFQLIWPPIIFSMEKQSFAGQFYARMLTYVLYISFGLGLLLSVFSPEIVLVIAPVEYRVASQIIFPLLIGSILFMAQNVFNVGLLLYRKTIYWSLAIILETVICSLLWITLIPKLGLYAIAISLAISYGAGALITYLISRRFLRIEYEWKRVFILFGAFVTLIWIAQMIPVESMALLIASKILLLISYIVAPFLFKFWYPEEVSSATKIVQQITGSFRALLTFRIKMMDFNREKHIFEDDSVGSPRE